MLDIEALRLAINMLLDINVFFYIVLGLFIGMVFGAIPGISGMLLMGVMIVPTYYLSPIEAIAFLTAIWTGCTYGGGVTAILFNIPGSPGAIATGFDGYEMTKQGKHNEAIGAGLVSSALGCSVSYTVILFLLIPMGRIFLLFRSPEMVMIVLCAIIVVGVVRDSMIKTIIAGAIGILLATMGTAPYGEPRSVVYILAFRDQLPLIPMLLGILAVSELFFMIDKESIIQKGVKVKKDIRLILKGAKAAITNIYTLVVSLFIGISLGLLPALGSTVACVVSYGTAKRSCSKPENFGKGDIKGVIAAETANNAAEGGSIAVMMSFGIPGSAGAAILMAAFMIHGMTPGPYLIREGMDLAYSVILINIFQGVGILAIGLLFVYYFSDVVRIKTRILAPVIMSIAALGTLGIRGRIEDMILLAVMGVFAYFLKRFDFPIISLVLGFILGRMMERELTRTMIIYGDNYLNLFTRPLFVALVLLLLFLIFLPQVLNLFRSLFRTFFKRGKAA